MLEIRHRPTLRDAVALDLREESAVRPGTDSAKLLKRRILQHFVDRFGAYDDSGHRFFPGAGCSAEVYRFPPNGSREVYSYAAVHAHTGMPTTEGHAEQFFAVSRGPRDVLLDLVAVCATWRCGDGGPIAEWTALPLAREIPGTRGMDRLLIAPAVFEADAFRHLAADGAHLRFLWVIPAFAVEADYRDGFGSAAIEAKLFARGVDLADLERAPVT